MNLFFITVMVVSGGFFAGRSLVLFVLHNKPARQFTNRIISERIKKDEMPESFHRIRFVRDVDSAGAGIFAALALWILETTRGEWNPLTGLLGVAVTGLLSNRAVVPLNVGRIRDVFIATYCYLAVMFLIMPEVSPLNRALGIIFLTAAYYIIAK